MTRPLAKTEGGIAAARDAGLSFGDALTMGYGSQALGAQDAVKEANANLGILAPLVQGGGYVAGPGKVLGPLARGAVGLTGLGTEAGAGLAARLGASAAGGGLEGGAAGGLGAGGHGGDVAQGALTGGLEGAAIGGLFGGSGPAPKAPEVGEANPITPGSLYAKKTAAYAPLDSTYFDSPTYNAALTQGHSVIRNLRDPQGQGANLGIPKDVSDIVNNLSQEPVVTGRVIQEASRDLRATGDWTGHRYADALDKALNTAQPMSVNGQPTGQIGAAGAAQKAGDDLWGRIKDLNRLSQEGPTGAPGPTPGAIQATKSNWAQGTPEYDALTALQGAVKPGFNWSHLRHAVAPLAFEGAALGEHYMDPDDQYPWLRAGLHGLAAGSMFTALPAIAAARPGPAINAARYTLGTGQPMTTPTGRLGNSLLQLMLGRAAGGS